MKRSTPYLMITLLAMVWACDSFAREPLPVATAVEVATWAEAIGQGRAVLTTQAAQRPAMSVAVMVAGDLVWSEAIGWASVDPQVPATSMTRFRAYSVAKSLTGTLAVKMAQTGELDLDAPISNYLNGLPPATAAVTMRQLLGHLGGVRHYKSGEWMKLAKNHCENAGEAIGTFAPDPLTAEPGSAFSYSSFSFVLASAVLEVAGDASFPQLMKEEIFTPGGMSSTGPDSPAHYTDTTATPYEWKRKARTLPEIDNSCKFGAGSLLTTAEDLARFGSRLLSGSYISGDMMNSLFQPQVTSGGEQTPYSLGWGVSTDGMQIGHSGGSPGGRAYLLLDREHNVVVAMLSNVEGERLNQAASDLLDLFSTDDN